MRQKRLVDVTGINPVTVNDLSYDELGIDNITGAMYINNSDKIKKLGGGVFIPSKYNEGANGSTNGNSSSTGWVTVLNLNAPCMINRCTISTSVAGVQSELRIIKDGVELPILQVTHDAGVLYWYTGLSYTSSTSNATGVDSQPIYCEESVSVAVRYVSGDPAANINCDIQYQEGNLK